MNKLIKDIKAVFSRDSKFETHNPVEQGFNSQVKVIGEDERLVSLDQFRMTPKRIEREATLHDIESLKQYIDAFSANTEDKCEENQHHGTATAFVGVNLTRRDPVSVECILDYHTSPKHPANCDHRIRLDCTVDHSFAKWLGSDNDWMSQSELVQFFKRNNSFFADSQELIQILGTVEDIKSSTDRRDRSQAAVASTEVNMKFKLLGKFDFRFKPIPAINKAYQIEVDVYADYGRNGGLQVKYSIRNPDSIWKAVATDIRKTLSELGDKLVVF